MASKPFSQDLHDEYDERGRNAAKQLFKRWGIELRDNPDKYGVDLIAYKDGKMYGCVEVEVRDAWKGNFAYDTLNIPYRKQKLLNTPENNCLVAFNADCTQAFIANDWTVLFSQIEEVKNKHMDKGELFYKVPINQLRLVTL